MNKNRIFIASLALFAHNHIAYADEVITLFFKPYPVLGNNEYSNQMSRSLREPGALEMHKINNILQHDISSGIFSTYYGYLGVSDFNGQTTYPRRVVEPDVYVLVTSRITPNVITGNTIHHWELETDTPAMMYHFERKKDIYSNLAYWDVTKADLPLDKRVPLQAVVIFANPNDIYIPTGITVTKENQPNIVLPDIYVKKGINLTATTLYVLNIRQFFGPVHFLDKQKEKSYSSLVVPHPRY